MVEDRASAALARKVPIYVVRKVYDRSLVGTCHVGDLQSVIVVEVEARLDIYLARVVLVTVGRHQREDHTVGLHTALPHAVGKALRAAVQVVDSIIDLEAVLHPLDRHAAARYAVGNTADTLAAGGAVSEVAHRILVSQHHVVDLAVAVGNLHLHDRCSYVAQLHLAALRVAYRVEHDSLAFGGRAPHLL